MAQAHMSDFKFPPPSPGHLGHFLHLMQYIEPNGPESGPIDPISYTMIVSGLLNPFLAILDFFDSYHALATLCKLKNLENSAFLAIFGVKNGRNWTFWGSFFWSKNRCKSSHIGRKIDFLDFLNTLGYF